MKDRLIQSALALVCLGWLLSGCASAPQPDPVAPPAPDKPIVWDGSPSIGEELRYRPVAGMRGMVVSDDQQASEWGATILRQGGNAVDAAVAVGFMLSVTRPQYGSLGGGGFMTYCPKPSGGKPAACQVIDYREKAPLGAGRDMYLRDGKAVPALSQDGPLASGVPGVPAGLLLALEKFGTFTRERILAEPIRAARSGIRMSGNTEFAAEDRWEAMNEAGKKIFGCPVPGAKSSGAKTKELRPCQPGTHLVQEDLGRVLEAISARGTRGFYEGPVAARIAAGFRKAGGIITEKDLAAYRPSLREPVSGRFKNYEVVTMPPPSAGGVVILQMLQYAAMAERQGELADGPGAARTIHAMTYAMSLGFADRARVFGDPDHVKVPLKELLDPKYLEAKWKTFDPAHARIAPESALQLPESNHTTHFSVTDREGNAVSVTTTVNDNFGSAFVPPGTGVVMNNEMDDFSAQPGVPNLYGLVGAEANAIVPGKKPLSSMSPTIVRDLQGNNLLVLGAQGGPRITTAVFQALMNRLEFNLPITDAVIAPRFHHQWKPGTLMLERYGFSEDTRRRLVQLGYTLKDISAGARMAALERFPQSGRVWGAHDPRTEGAAVAE